MESIQQEEENTNRRLTLADRLRSLEKKVLLKERSEESIEKTKDFKFPFKWRAKFKRAKRKSMNDMMLVFFLNKKNEIEHPRFMPIFDSNMIVWKDKPYEFDPRAVWTIQGLKGSPKAYLIKEIDRRPVMNQFGKIIYKDASVSNMDLDEVRRRGDYTGSDEFLIKAALKAQTTRMKKNVNVVTIIIVSVLLIGGLLWFMLKG